MSASLETTRKAIALSGPNKWFRRILLMTTKGGCVHSRFHNRWPIPWQGVKRKIEVPMDLKRKKAVQLYVQRYGSAPWLETKDFPGKKSRDE